MTPGTTFEARRPRLIRLAYRMLGSIAEAEDAVQDATPRFSVSQKAAARLAAARPFPTGAHQQLDILQCVAICVECQQAAAHERSTPSTVINGDQR